MNALKVTANDLRIYSRDRGALILLLLVPVILMVVASAALSGAFGGGGDRVTLYVADEDKSELSRQLLGPLADSSTLKLDTSNSAAQLREKVEKGDVGGGIVIPAGFGATVLAGRTVQLQVLKHVS